MPPKTGRLNKVEIRLANGYQMSENMVQKRREIERRFHTMPQRKHHDSRFKTQVAIEAIKNQQTIAQIAILYLIHFCPKNGGKFR